jgi:hypothetical protein
MKLYPPSAPAVRSGDAMAAAAAAPLSSFDLAAFYPKRHMRHQVDWLSFISTQIHELGPQLTREPSLRMRH